MRNNPNIRNAIWAVTILGTIAFGISQVNNHTRDHVQRVIDWMESFQVPDTNAWTEEGDDQSHQFIRNVEFHLNAGLQFPTYMVHYEDWEYTVSKKVWPVQMGHVAIPQNNKPKTIND